MTRREANVALPEFKNRLAGSAHCPSQIFCEKLRGGSSALRSYSEPGVEFAISPKGEGRHAGTRAN
jgi:hypothetical protein